MMNWGNEEVRDKVLHQQNPSEVYRYTYVADNHLIFTSSFILFIIETMEKCTSCLSVFNLVIFSVSISGSNMLVLNYAEITLPFMVYFSSSIIYCLEKVTNMPIHCVSLKTLPASVSFLYTLHENLCEIYVARF